MPLNQDPSTPGAAGAPDSVRAERSAADFTSARSAGFEAPESEGLYRLLVASVRDYALFALDRNGHVLSWNDGAARIKGYAANEIIGKHFSVFYPEERVAEGFPQYELEVAAREGSFEDEGWRLRKDGTRFWANVIITALRNDDGAVVGFAKVTRDLTERRRVEQELLESTSRAAAAEASSRAKTEFLAAMSHELRTPLNAIGGYADLMEEGVYGPLTEAQHDALDRLRRSQRHLLAIIEDLLSYGQIEAGGVRFDIAPVPVMELLDDVHAMVEPDARRNRLRLERVACPDTLAVRADRARTEQVLINLLANAVKFTPAGGTIRVSCKHEGDRVLLSVSDTGPGIPEDQLDAIFEPFVQVGRSLNRPKQGTGLGLAISRDIARGMGGTLTVASKPGQGATFTLDLPAV